MAEKTKAQMIQLLTNIVNEKKSIKINGVFIEDGGTCPLEVLTTDDGEVGAISEDWFYPLTDLTKKELVAVYKVVK